LNLNQEIYNNTKPKNYQPLSVDRQPFLSQDPISGRTTLTLHQTSRQIILSEAWELRIP
jgi:hypothetical protein